LSQIKGFIYSPSRRKFSVISSYAARSWTNLPARKKIDQQNDISTKREKYTDEMSPGSREYCP